MRYNVKTHHYDESLRENINRTKTKRNPYFHMLYQLTIIKLPVIELISHD